VANEAESAKTAAARARADFVETIVVLNIVIDSSGARAFDVVFSARVPGARRRTKETLAGIYRMTLPIGNIGHVTDR
jgi:hypothetical protein